MDLSDTTMGVKLLSNPGLVQRAVLMELNNRLNGIITIADPNNSFMFLMEAGSSWTSEFVRETEQVFNAIYPKRATTAEELARHMSDNDYLNATAKPASLMVQMLFDRDYIANNSEVYNDDYLKLIIPGTTKFSIGGRTYGLYYPIEIRTNRRTGFQFVAYDTATDNPLHQIAVNTLENVTTFTRNGLNVLAITFPVYQFVRTRSDFNLNPPEQGFRETFKFTDKFYAIRAFTDKGGVWTEMQYTLSDDVYDRSVATLKIGLQQDAGKLVASVPQIYFTRGLMGSRLRVELYTTQGSLDAVITEAEAEAASCDFDLQADTTTAFSTILGTMPTKKLIVQQSTVVGGSNGLSFEELRTRVVNQSLYDRLPISPEERANYLKDRGFVLTTYVDNITDRICFANRRLVGGANGTIPVTVANVELKSSNFSQISTIKSFSDNTITVLPTTLYRYEPTANLCIPLTDAEVSRLAHMTAEQLAAELNTTTYTRQPFHLVTYAGKYPLSKSFNLNSPKTNSIVFERENANASAQMSLLDAVVTHLGEGTGGYKIYLGVQKTADLAAVSESSLAILLMFQDRAGRIVHARASLYNTTSTMSIYEVTIPTTYYISADQYLRTTLLTADGSPVSCDIPLTTKIDVRFLVDAALFPTVRADYTITSGVPIAYTSMLGLVQQSLSITLGTDLSDGIYNITTAEWSREVYATYPENVYWTYSADEYQRNPDGSYTVVDGTIQLVKIHSAGDVMEDGDGNPVVRYAAGSFRRDADGNPIVASGRELVYYIETTQFDARLYASQVKGDIDYLKTVGTEITDYVTTVSTIADSLIEQTKLYFHPIRTMGTASFGLGNSSTTRVSLGLSFSIKYFVPVGVLQNEALLQIIRNTTKSIITTHVSKPVISMTGIATDLRAALGENVTSVDVGDINATPGLQTLMANESDSAPMVALKLVAKTDGTLALEQAISVVFYSDT